MGVFDGEQFRVLARNGVPDFSEIRYLVRPGGNAPIERLAQGEPLIHIADVRLTDAYGEHPGFRANMDSQAVRTLLGVPLRKDGALLGAITAFRREVQPFSDKQIALLQNFAAQAVIAMENARLITETREALEQQTATAEVLQVINSSPGDLAPVFDAMLDKAMHLCGASFGLLTRVEGENFRAVALRGAPPALAELLRQPQRAAPGQAHYRAMQGEDVVHVEDITTENVYRSGDPARRALADIGGARTGLCVALRKEDALLGTIIVYRKEVRLFSNKQIALLQNFAAQAVIAIENARLITETREALEQQTATTEVLGVINSSPGELAPVFEAILDNAHTFCGANAGAMFLYDGEYFRAVAMHRVPEPFADRLRRGLRGSDELLTQALLSGEPLYHVPDLTAVDDPLHRAGVKRGTRALLAVPLRKGDTLLGMITGSRPEPLPFTNKQITLLQSFAAQAVIAMENARLLGELRQRTEEVAELNRGLEARVAEQVEELGRVGRLKRFLAPQLAELIVSQGDEKILESHRREIVVVFCDLRGYTAFTETAEPEEVLDFLREYHGALGPLVSQFEGTLDQFSGDGIMVFFNDPVPCPDPAERAVKMSMAMREAAGKLITAWRPRGCELGFGAGIAWGYATLGQIGFADRSGYTAIGTVCNLAARLCDEAKDGQILITGRVAAALGTAASLEDLGNLELKGFSRPVAAFNVVQSSSPAEARPNLTVVTRGPGA